MAVFQGGFKLEILALMMQWEESDVASLARELIETGLASPNRYNHLTLNPALCPYLRGRMEAAEFTALTARWVKAMRAYVKFLVQQQSQNTEMAATLAVLELPNLFALLDLVQRAGDAETTIAVATSLHSLLRLLGKPRLLERIGQIRDAAAATLGETWSHARFEAQRTKIEQLLAGGRLHEALEGAQQLLQKARSGGEKTYSGADYDLAGAHWLLARVLKTAGRAEQALPLLGEAEKRFEAIVNRSADKAAEGMVSGCFADRGDCLRILGRLDDSAAAYEENIHRAERLRDERQVAVGKAQLGTVRMLQRRYPEALAAYAEAREMFARLDEPGTVARIWHQTGMAYQEAGQSEPAEDAYRKALAIKVRLGDTGGQASTLVQLGNLYDSLGRLEQATTFYRQAADKYVEIHDLANESRARNNLANTLTQLRRFDEARQEIRRAIECKAQFGHASEPWKTWAKLADIETDAGNPAAAAEAKTKAVASYLPYRRDGGENHFTDGRICFEVTQHLLASNPSAAASLLQQLAADPDFKGPIRTLIQALQAIVAGSRDRALAAAPDLSYVMSAEILFLIETLEKRPTR